ncbi:hypothetical protein EWM64_g4665 [Hericium alpestre]|uniref:Uncharacterized protein n=1 Tax=Hericium alpestre TaxID=135208 RepID=A0A4Y9ZZ27_9AGAM|nr:hypothetical protein EWM64_g4665 [Hericium alpestre]
MQHILTECPGATPTLIWNLARDLWPYPPATWLPVTLGLIYSECKLQHLKANGTRNAGATRLL